MGFWPIAAFLLTTTKENAMSRYMLTCLLCPPGQMAQIPAGTGDLVAYQEHAMQEHGVSQEAMTQAMRATLPVEAALVYVWMLPDRQPWLRAERLLGLVRAGLAAGYTPQALATALDMSWDVLAKLEAGVIAGESIPASQIAKMAELLKVAPALVEAYLDAPPEDSPFRCGPERQPLWTQKQSLRQAVLDSPALTGAQRDRWLARLNAEGKE
jgi:hypothetical protein